MNFEQHAKNIVEVRNKITEIENQFEEILTPLKMERDKMQQEIIEGLKEMGTVSFKTLDKTIGISISERKSIQVLNEEEVIAYLKKRRLKDLFAVQLVKPLVKGFFSQAMKEDVKIPGTEIKVTEFISVRNLKKGEKAMTKKD